MHRDRFSLASLLLLTAVVAVYFGALASAWSGRAWIDTETVAACAVAGFAVGAVVGSVAGWRRIGKVRGVFIGGGTGIAAGVAGGVLMAMPGTFGTIAVGSPLLLLFAVVVRSCSPGPRR